MFFLDINFFDSLVAYSGGGFSLILYLVKVRFLWLIFKKAGKSSWKSIFPLYNDYVLFNISGLKQRWFIFFILAYFFRYIIVFCMYKLSDGFGDYTLILFLITAVVAGFFDLVRYLILFNCYYNLNKKFSVGRLGEIVLLLSTGSIIFNSSAIYIGSLFFLGILALSKDTDYNHSIPVSKNGVFGIPDNSNYQSNDTRHSTASVDINNSDATEKKCKYSFCGNCGTKLDDGIRFCHNCGKEIK